MKVEDQLALILTKMDAQSKGISKNNQCLQEVHDSVAELTAAKAEFEHWRPKVDGQVADLRDCVNNLRQQLDERWFRGCLHPRTTSGQWYKTWIPSSSQWF